MIAYLKKARVAIETVIDDPSLRFVASELAGVLYFIRLATIDIQKRPELVATNDFIQLTIIIDRSMAIILNAMPDYRFCQTYLEFLQICCAVHLQSA